MAPPGELIPQLEGDGAHLRGERINPAILLLQLRVRHFAHPAAAFLSIAIDDKCLHDIFSNGAASSCRSLRIPASTRPEGANLRSNRRRLASPPEGYRSFG